MHLMVSMINSKCCLLADALETKAPVLSDAFAALLAENVEDCRRYLTSKFGEVYIQI